MLLFDIPIGIPFLDATTSFIVILVGFLFLFSIYRNKDDDKERDTFWDKLNEVEKLLLIAVLGLIIYFLFSEYFGGAILGLNLSSYKLGSLLYSIYGNQLSGFLLNIGNNILSTPPNNIILASIEEFLLLLFSPLIALLVLRRLVGRFFDNSIADYYFSFLFLLFPFIMEYLISIFSLSISYNYGIFLLTFYKSSGFSSNNILNTISISLFIIAFVCFYAGSILLSNKIFSLPEQSSKTSTKKEKMRHFNSLSFILSDILLLILFITVVFPNLQNIYNQPSVTTSIRPTGILGLYANISLNSSQAQFHNLQPETFDVNVTQMVAFKNGLNYTIDIYNTSSSINDIKEGFLPLGYITNHVARNLSYESYSTNTTLFNNLIDGKYIILGSSNNSHLGSITFTISSSSSSLATQIFNISLATNASCVSYDCLVTFRIDNLNYESDIDVYDQIILPVSTTITNMSVSGYPCPIIRNNNGSINNFNCYLNTNHNGYVGIGPPVSDIPHWTLTISTNSIQNLTINFTVRHSS